MTGSDPQQSKGSYSHYQRKLCTQIIDQPVHLKDHPSHHPIDKPAHYRQCDGRIRHFEPAPDGSPEGERNVRGV